MSYIAIRDLNEDITLDRAAMGQLDGGKGGHCPKGSPGYYLPDSDHERRDSKSLDLGQMGAGVSQKIDDLLNIAPKCGPMDVVK